MCLTEGNDFSQHGAEKRIAREQNKTTYGCSDLIPEPSCFRKSLRFSRFRCTMIKKAIESRTRITTFTERKQTHTHEKKRKKTLYLITFRMTLDWGRKPPRRRENGIRTPTHLLWEVALQKISLYCLFFSFFFLLRVKIGRF